nr:hypothetical protein [Tanacetum cinerariifolium]
FVLGKVVEGSGDSVKWWGVARIGGSGVVERWREIRRMNMDFKRGGKTGLATWDVRLEIVKVKVSSFVGISFKSLGEFFSSVGKQLAKLCEAKSLESSVFIKVIKRVVSWLTFGYKGLAFSEATSASAVAFRCFSSSFWELNMESLGVDDPGPSSVVESVEASCPDVDSECK